jgi:phenylalanine-4-hydroxylase
LYWYTIEFGLLRKGHGVRAYGAGILSSSGELTHSVTSTQPARTALQTQANLLRCMASTYKIDTYQQQYFVIDSFDALLALTAPDFTPYYLQLLRVTQTATASSS